MGTAAIVTPPTGALLDRYSAKAIVVAGSLASALGYAGFAYVDHPWQAFACSIVSGVGIGAALTANRTLTIRLVTREQRAASFALNRVAGNFGVGSGATLAGFIVESAQRLSSFQMLYFFDAATYAGYALIVLAAVPSPRAETVTATDANGTGFRAVAQDRLFLTVIAANIVRRRRPHVLLQHPATICKDPHTARPRSDRDPLSRQHVLHRHRADPGGARSGTDATHTRFRGDRRAFCGRPARGAASDAHPLGARCDQSPRRRCDRLRNRRMRTHSRSRATGRGHGSSPSARPLPVTLQSDLHHLPGPRPGDWRPSPADLTRRRLVGWRACRGGGRSGPASTRQPHSRPAPRSTVTSWVGARGRVRACLERTWPQIKLP